MRGCVRERERTYDGVCERESESVHVIVCVKICVRVCENMWYFVCVCVFQIDINVFSAVLLNTTRRSLTGCVPNQVFTLWCSIRQPWQTLIISDRLCSKSTLTLSVLLYWTLQCDLNPWLAAFQIHINMIPSFVGSSKIIKAEAKASLCVLKGKVQLTTSRRSSLISLLSGRIRAIESHEVMKTRSDL